MYATAFFLNKHPLSLISILYIFIVVCKTQVVILYCPQTAIRRADDQDRQRAEAGLATPGPSMSRFAPATPEAEVEPVIVRPWWSPIVVPLVRKADDAALDLTTS